MPAVHPGGGFAMLRWSPDSAHRSVTAVGGKGIYIIKALSNGEVLLDGRGHDGITMLALVPPRRFRTLSKAKDHAAALERVGTKEPEASGSG